MFCVHCGAAVASDAPVCGVCGKPSGVGRATGAAGPVAGCYAGFWRRLGAYLIDAVVVSAGAFAVMIAAFVLPKDLRPLLSLIVILVGQWLYFAFMWSSQAQATFGKQALGIKIADLDGNRIGFGRASGRYFAQIVTALTFGVGYAMIVFTRRRQSLHDVMAGTVVVRQDRSPAEVASAIAPPVPGYLVAVAIIAIVLFNPAGIGILAAIAIPAYQDYTIRAQVMEGLVLAEPAKSAVVAGRASGLDWAGMTNAALSVPPGEGRYVARVEINHGAVIIVYGQHSNSKLAGKVLVLVPYESAGSVGWSCGHALAPVGAAIAIDDAARYTTLPDVYLPARCRA